MMGEQLHALADKIAAELTKLRDREAWLAIPFKPGDYIATIEQASEVKIYVNGNVDQHIYLHLDKADRITVGGCFPRHSGNIHPDANERPGSITVSATRSAEALARTINSRYVDAYMTAFAKGTAEIKRWTDSENAKEDLAASLAADYGGRVGDRNKCEVIFNLPATRPDIEVNSKSSVDFKLSSISPELARVLIAALVAHVPPKRCKKCNTLLGYRDMCMNADCDYHDVGQDSNMEKVHRSELVRGDVVKVLDEWRIVKSIQDRGVVTFNSLKVDDDSTTTLTLDPKIKYKRHKHEKD